MRIDNSPIRFSDYIFLILFIILNSRDSFYFLFSNNTRQELLLIPYIYFIGRILTSYLYQRLKLYWTIGIPMILTIISLSALWSGSFFHSLKFSMIQIVLSAMVIIFIANKYKIITVMKITFLSGTIMTICSYIVVFINPSWGLMTEDFVGLWRGIFAHKNLLSVSSCFHIIITLFLLLYDESKLLKRLVYLGVMTLQLLLILLSEASTGILTLLISFIFSILLIFVIKIKDKYLLMSFFSLYMIFVGVSIFILFSMLENIVLVFGKDLTFSGRTIIWEYVVNMIWEKPFFGYGYGVFWQEGGFTFNYVNQYVPWNDLHHQAHNGFLDILTSVGWVGFTIIIFTVFVYFKKNIRLIIRTKNKLYILPLIYLIFFLIYNFQESFFMEQNYIMWSFYVYFYTFLSIKTKKV